MKFFSQAKLAKWISERPSRVIGIDGLPGSGKTCLSEELEHRLTGFTKIGLDDYYAEDIKTAEDVDRIRKNGFVESLNYKQLEEDILTCNKRNIVVEGVCLLSVAERINLNIDLLIYIKMSKKADVRFGKKSSGTHHLDYLDYECKRYLASHEPHHKAHITFYIPKQILPPEYYAQSDWR